MSGVAKRQTGCDPISQHSLSTEHHITIIAALFASMIFQSCMLLYSRFGIMYFYYIQKLVIRRL